MDKCKLGIYSNNNVITQHPFRCFGGIGLKPCQYLEECATEQKVKLSKKIKKVLKLAHNARPRRKVPITSETGS